MTDQRSTVSLVLDISSFLQPASTAQGSIQGLHAGVEQFAAAWNNEARANETATRQLQQHASVTNTASQAVQSFAGQVGTLITAFAGFSVLREVQQGLTGLIGSFVDAGAKMESWRTTMGSIMDGMTQVADREKALAQRTDEVSREFSRKWREADEARGDAADKYAHRRTELEERLSELDGRTLEERKRKFAEAEAERDHAHSQTILHLEQREQDANAKFGRDVDDRLAKWATAQAEIERRHAQTVGDIGQQQTDLGRNYAIAVDERQAKWTLHLREMESSHQQTVLSIQDQMAGLAQDTADKLADMAQQYSNRREDLASRFEDRGRDLRRRLQQARTPDQRRTAQEALRELDEDRRTQEARLARDEAQANERVARETQRRADALQKRLDGENAKYEKARLFQEEQHNLEVAAAERAYQASSQKLTERMNKAEEEYRRETKAAEDSRDAAIDAANETHRQTVAAIHAQVDESNEEYERGRGLREQAEQESLAKLAATEETRRQTLLRQLGNLDADYLKTLRDLDEKVKDLAVDQAKALKTATEATPPNAASTLQYLADLGLATNSSKESMDALEEHLLKVAETTPFTTDKLLKTVQMLAAVGVDATKQIGLVDRSGSQITREFIDVLGDWKAAMSDFGEGAQEAILNVFRYVQGGRFGEAMENLRQLGINPADLEQFGVRMNKAGQIVEGQGQIIGGVLQIVQNKFGGVSEAQSKTWTGILANLQDYGFRLARFAGEPFFAALRDNVKALYDALGSKDQPELSNTIRGLADTLVGGLANAVRIAGDVVRQAIPVFTGLTTWGSEDLTPLQRVLLLGRDAFTAFGAIIAEHGPLIAHVLESLGLAVAVLLGEAALGGLVAFLIGPVGATLIATTVAIEVFRRAWDENWGGVRDKVAAVVGWLQSDGLPMLGQFSDWLSETLAAALKEAAGWLQEHVLPLLDRLAAWLDEQHEPLGRVGEAFGLIAGTVAGLAVAIGQTLLPILRDWAGFLAEKFLGYLELWGQGLSILGKGLDALTEKLPVVLQWAINFGRNAGEAFSGLGTAVHNALFGDDGEGGIIGALKNFGPNAANALKVIGVSITQGVFAGIAAALNAPELTDWAKTNVVEPLVRLLKSALGIASPAATMLPVGASTADGVFAGLSAQWVKDLDGVPVLVDKLDAKLDDSVDKANVEDAGKATVRDFMAGFAEQWASLIAHMAQDMRDLVNSIKAAIGLAPLDDEGAAAAGKFQSGFRDGMATTTAKAPAQVEDLTGAIRQAVDDADTGDAGATLAEDFSDGFTESWDGLQRDTVPGLVSDVAETLQTEADDADTESVGASIGDGVETGLIDSFDGLQTDTVPEVLGGFAGTLHETVDAMMPQVEEDGRSIGQAHTDGVVEGIEGGTQEIQDALAAQQAALAAFAAQREAGLPLDYHGGVGGPGGATGGALGIGGLAGLLGPLGGSGGGGLQGSGSRGTNGGTGNVGVNPWGGVSVSGGGLAAMMQALAGTGGPWAREGGVPGNGITAFWSAISQQGLIGNTLGGIDFSGGLSTLWSPTQYAGGQPLPFQNNPILGALLTGGASSYGTGGVPADLLRDYNLAVAGFQNAQTDDEARYFGGLITEISARMMQASGGYVGRQPPGGQLTGAWQGPGLTGLGRDTLPRLAAGGIATQPTTVVVGEGQHNEAILPLPPGGALVQVAHFADQALMEWYGRFVPVGLDLTAKVTDAVKDLRTRLEAAIGQTTAATRDLLPLGVVASSLADFASRFAELRDGITALKAAFLTTFPGGDGALAARLTSLQTAVVAVTAAVGLTTAAITGAHATLHADLATTLHADVRDVAAAVRGQPTSTGGGGTDTSALATHQDQVNILNALRGTNVSDNLATLTALVGVAVSSTRDTLHADNAAIYGALVGSGGITAALGELGGALMLNANSNAGGLASRLDSVRAVLASIDTSAGITSLATAALNVATGNTSQGGNRTLLTLLYDIRKGTSPGLPLAAGGLVLSPTHALIGEAGPELVLPLSRLGEVGGRGLAPVLEYHAAPRVKELGEADFEQAAWRFEQQFRGRL